MYCVQDQRLVSWFYLNICIWRLLTYFPRPGCLQPSVQLPSCLVWKVSNSLTVLILPMLFITLYHCCIILCLILVSLVAMASLLEGYLERKMSFSSSDRCSLKTGTRRIIRLDDLSSVVRLERRTTEDSSSRRIMRLVPVFTLETNNKCLPKFVQTDNASSSIKTANLSSSFFSNCSRPFLWLTIILHLQPHDIIEQ